MEGSRGAAEVGRESPRSSGRRLPEPVRPEKGGADRRARAQTRHAAAKQAAGRKKEEEEEHCHNHYCITNYTMQHDAGVVGRRGQAGGARRAQGVEHQQLLPQLGEILALVDIWF